MSYNKLANVTSLLSEDEKLMIAHIYDPVANYQSFTGKSAFPLTILNKISDYNSTKSDIEVFLSQLLSNSNGTKSMKQLKQAFENFVNIDSIPGKSTVMEGLLFKEPNSFVDKVVDKFKTIVAPIGTSYTIPREYNDNMLSVCSHNYYVVYQQLYRALQNSGSSYSNSFPFMSLSSIESISQNLTRAINNNITFYPGVDTVEDYTNKCYSAVYDSTINEYINDSLNCEIYSICFMPYFTFKYLLNFITTAVVDSTNKAPRNAIIRRIATQAVYESVLFMIYAVYMLSSKYSPNSEQTYELRMLLDTAVTQVFDKESSVTESEENYIKMHKDTSNIFEMNEKLRNISDDIEVSRNSISSVMTNSTDLDNTIKTTKIVYWVWVALTLIYLSYFVLVIIVFKKGGITHDVYLIVGIIFLIILTILGIVKLSSS